MRYIRAWRAKDFQAEQVVRYLARHCGLARLERWQQRKLVSDARISSTLCSPKYWYPGSELLGPYGSVLAPDGQSVIPGSFVAEVAEDGRSMCIVLGDPVRPIRVHGKQEATLEMIVRVLQEEFGTRQRFKKEEPIQIADAQPELFAGCAR